MAATARLDDDRLASLLDEVGLGPGRAALDADGGPVFDPFRNPAASDELGRELADRLRALAPNVVCVWEEPENMVLAHIVGRELGVRWVRCLNAEGLVEMVGSLPEDARAAIVSGVASSLERVRAVKSLLAGHGGTVVTVAALLGTLQLDALGAEVPSVICLAWQRLAAD